MTTLQSNACQSNDPNNLFPMAIDSLRFPLDTTMRIIFTGHFNGFSVAVNSVDEMALLHQMGCFGKGSFSRSKPRIHQESLQIMRRRQFVKRNYWYKKFSNIIEASETDSFLSEAKELILKIKNDSKQKDVIDLVSSDEDVNEDEDDHRTQNTFDSNREKDMVVIVPNSDSEDDDYFANLTPQCCINKTKIPEKLMLTLQEAFFLSYGLGCLQVVHGDQILSIQQCWELFLETDKYFIQKYVVYHYYRAKGYVVKPAIKFGGDYLIYKEGPDVAHADYIVVIKNLTDFDWVSLLGHMRMANTTVKEIIIAEVSTEIEDVTLPEGLNKYTVRELLLSRNIPLTLNDDVN
ncbi:uncharacterized protein LOC106142249 [Amyelois transitella]|uniref:uncharacterized protein LOC106142249 n=1 Tax=Amyelois transitella TaxID=680683 RepID=UPI0029904F19|nr:uncharacterized protein LOC106142249 [Amyelois transitella]